MHRYDKVRIKQKRHLFEVGTQDALLKAHGDNRVLRQEVAELRERLTEAYAERDGYKRKLQLALGAMEDAREMASQERIANGR
jgi:hypothetical protein